MLFLCKGRTTEKIARHQNQQKGEYGWFWEIPFCIVIYYHNSMRKSILDFIFFLAYNKDVEKEGEIKMDITFLKLGIAIFIAIVGVYICFNVLTSEIKSSKSITMAGTENSYWNRNKSRSAEAKKDRIMKVAILLFLVATISANLLF